jgi:pimeloyl-ACP methyl ester carboxylesterase
VVRPSTTGTNVSILRAIDDFGAVQIGGVEQWLLVRGQSAQLPLLLFIHGGPGMPRIPEAGNLESRLGLEEHFLVAYWDLRGTGKTYRAGADSSRMTLTQLVEDTKEMIELLLARYGKDRLFLIGFSVGGSIATLVAAEVPNALAALITIGADIDFAESEKIGYAFALEAARQGIHRRALRELAAIGSPPHATPKAFTTRAKWVAEFGGIAQGHTFLSLVLSNIALLIRSPHYGLADIVRALRGMMFSQKHLLPHCMRLNLLTQVPRLDVPVYFLQGRKDQAAPAALAEKYHAAIDAPMGKRLIWFETAAHMPHVECPEQFRQILLAVKSEIERVPM